MNVFISWSGERSRAVAEALHKWLPKVVNAIKPWLSSADMDKGVRWSADVALRLEEAHAGIICLTPTNLHSDWILFEAGALSKTVENAFVCPFLIGVEPSDLKPPLSQFQCTRAEKEDVLKLLTTLNSALEDDALPETHIQEVFEVWWPKLDTQLKMLPSEEATRKQHRTDRELLEEVLSLVRDQNRSSNLSLQSTMSAVEQEEITEALKSTEGNVTLSAKLLGFSRQTLVNKMDRYGIPRNGWVEAKADNPSIARANE
jgi:DNA-binding protein Fis